MTDFVIDVGVLMSGSGLGASPSQGSSIRFMTSFAETLETELVVDDEGLILHQYETKLRGSFGEFWFRALVAQGRVSRVRRARLDRGTSTRLRELHLDSEDHKYYVRTAAASASKRLVSHDPDYSRSIRQCLSQRLAILILSAAQASQSLGDG